MVRLAKYIANCGVTSRRKAEELVRNGSALVNGQAVYDPALDINIDIDKITINGTAVTMPNFEYVLLNKPAGYTTTTNDKHAKKLITELVPVGLLPAGRLDKETSGLIIMTNDGDLIFKLTHPKFEHQKVYVAETKEALTTKDILNIKNGLVLDDGPIKPDHFEAISPNKYKITIHEGRNRIVRRIFEAVGKPLISLDRISIAELEDEHLSPGKYRILSKTEVEDLKK
jgi:23S rRNA pseudouridine2605 synthase